MNESQTKNCIICGKQVFLNENDILVHLGGGVYEQKCQNCGWKGGQVGSFQICPRCGDGTSLILDHTASI